jgi:hypothetical protein
MLTSDVGNRGVTCRLAVCETARRPGPPPFLTAQSDLPAEDARPRCPLSRNRFECRTTG